MGRERGMEEKDGRVEDGVRNGMCTSSAWY